MRYLLRAMLLVSLILLCACGGASSTSRATPAAQRQLTIFAAASLTDAFGEIGTSFEAAHPGISIVFNFAGSNQLAQQLAQGAPADLFASANQAQMASAITSGQVAAGSEQIFARNRLVLIYPKDNPAKLQTLQDLARPGVTIVLANKHVPAGQYALDVLAKAAQLPAYTSAYSATVLSNVVSYEENVRAVLSKVALGEADAGIVYSSDLAGAAGQQVGSITIPDQLNTIASYPIAPVLGAANADLARAFIELVLAPPGQQIMAKYGFISTIG